MNKTIPKKMRCKKAKWFLRKREKQRQGIKGKIHPNECRVPESSKKR